jgi:hypothetical protein
MLMFSSLAADMVGENRKGVGWARRVSDAVSRGKRLCAVKNFCFSRF